MLSWASSGAKASLATAPPIANPFAPISGSWTYTKGGVFFGTNTVTFYNDQTTGENPIAILPYRNGCNNQTEISGGEVISGEFNGCIMRVYKDDADGLVYVNHVDTAPGEGDARPGEDAWVAQKAAPGISLLNEFSTNNVISQLMGSSKSTKFLNQFLLCIATPQSGDYPITAFTVERNKDSS